MHRAVGQSTLPFPIDIRQLGTPSEIFQNPIFGIEVVSIECDGANIAPIREFANIEVSGPLMSTIVRPTSDFYVYLYDIDFWDPAGPCIGLADPTQRTSRLQWVVYRLPAAFKNLVIKYSIVLPSGSILPPTTLRLTVTS